VAPIAAGERLRERTGWFAPPLDVEGRMHKQSPLCYAVGAVIYRCDARGLIEVLLIKKQFGGWSLPKGGIKAGETDGEALLREVAEETALTGTVGAFVHAALYTITKRRRTRLKNVRYYLLHDARGTPSPGKQEGIRKVRWFELRRAIQRAHNDRVRTVLERAGVALSRGDATLMERFAGDSSLGQSFDETGEYTYVRF